MAKNIRKGSKVTIMLHGQKVKAVVLHKETTSHCTIKTEPHYIPYDGITIAQTIGGVKISELERL